MDPSTTVTGVIEEDINCLARDFERTPSWNERSPWEDGLDCIDSLLKEGSATYATMTNKQRIDLRNLKAMMLSGLDSTTNHIPRALLLDQDENPSADFLLSDYAGYTRRSEAPKSITGILSARKCARKFVRSARKSVRTQTVDIGGKMTTNIPAHWGSLDEHSKLKLRDLLSWENISRWDFNIFDVDEILQGKHTLIIISWAILASPRAQYAMDSACSKFSSSDEVEDLSSREGYDYLSRLNIDEKTLIEFLHTIEKKYNSTASYHNALHAADVVQSLHSILQMGGEKFADDPLEIFSLLVAAVIHDVGHAGMNNNFHINSRSEMALLYNDVSVLENMHLTTAFRLIMGEKRDKKLDIFENFDEEQTANARKFIIKAVLSTDMTKHFTKKNYIKGILLTQENLKALCKTLKNDVSLRHEILTYIIHMADISNPTKGFQIASKWTDKLLEECFRQGDEEKKMGLPFSPMCDRYSTSREQTQINFIKFIILPSFELLGELLPQVNKALIPQIRTNLSSWEELDRLKTESSAGKSKS